MGLRHILAVQTAMISFGAGIPEKTLEHDLA
jgi:hypothetical protein